MSRLVTKIDQLTAELETTSCAGARHVQEGCDHVNGAKDRRRPERVREDAESSTLRLHEDDSGGKTQPRSPAGPAAAQHEHTASVVRRP